MSIYRLSAATMLLFGWLLASSAVNAQPPSPNRDADVVRPPSPRDGRPQGPRPDVPPRDGPRSDGRRPDGPRPDGPPRDSRHEGPPHQGPHRNGPPHDGPPHRRFGQEHELRQLEELKELDPEMYELEKADRELERATMELSEKLRRAPEEKREPLKKQLSEVVSKHFDIRQARRKLHVKRLSEEVENLRSSIERRNEVRDQIIERRVSELVGKEDDLAF